MHKAHTTTPSARPPQAPHPHTGVPTTHYRPNQEPRHATPPVTPTNSHTNPLRQPASLPTLITIKIQRRRQIGHHRPVHRAKDSNPHSMPVTRPRTTSLTTTVHSNNIPVKHLTIPPAGDSDRSRVVHPLTLPHVRTKNTPITTPPATDAGIPRQPTTNNRIGAPHSRVTPTNVSRIKNHTPRRHTPNHTRRNPNSHSIRHTHHRALPRFICPARLAQHRLNTTPPATYHDTTKNMKYTTHLQEQIQNNH